MTIIETNKIDMIGYKIEDKVCSLGITDHLPWEDILDHKNLIQNKVNMYLEYILSGQANEYFKGEDIVEYKIILYTKYELPSKTTIFFEKLKEQISLVNKKIKLVVDKPSL